MAKRLLGRNDARSVRADPPREVSEEDVESINRGWAVELVERWRGSFVGDKLVRAGEESSLIR
jgi:hypothetical protein